ncbi:hypothetical protein AOZ06_21145 [Kibdelosporangium phytohabitans]|uniref:Uncharacterized protein n=1 Tax=Kibdelosporangium phytohabitans TaxID=860235 RepID=A0A0N9HZV3_9PSEU|nr:hypothetical protein AOZ06_21145 [Kibdelosporangium phytohabitans]
MEDRQLTHLPLDLRHEPDRAGPGADHRDEFAGQVVLVVPLGGVESPARKSAIPGMPGPDGRDNWPTAGMSTPNWNVSPDAVRTRQRPSNSASVTSLPNRMCLSMPCFFAVAPRYAWISACLEHRRGQVRCG